MQPRNLEQRVTTLEEQMQALKDLPARMTAVESQILQLRTEMKDGFSAIRADVRAELHGVEAGLRTELHEIRDNLRGEMHTMRDNLGREMHTMREELRGEMHAIRNALGDDIKKGIEETQALMKLLHEHAMKEIAKQR